MREIHIESDKTHRQRFGASQGSSISTFLARV
jgi:hypothetical protein